MKLEKLFLNILKKMNEYINVDYLLTNKNEFKRFLELAVKNGLHKEDKYKQEYLVNYILNYVYYLKRKELANY
jgi:hypothetical protein